MQIFNHCHCRFCGVCFTHNQFPLFSAFSCPISFQVNWIFAVYRLHCVSASAAGSVVTFFTAPLYLSVKSFITLTRTTILNYSKTTRKHTVYRRFGFRKMENMNRDEGIELPTEPRMGQDFTYWWPAPEVSTDEGFRREAEASINRMFPGCL